MRYQKARFFNTIITVSVAVLLLIIGVIIFIVTQSKNNGEGGESSLKLTTTTTTAAPPFTGTSAGNTTSTAAEITTVEISSAPETTTTAGQTETSTAAQSKPATTADAASNTTVPITKNINGPLVSYVIEAPPAGRSNEHQKMVTPYSQKRAGAEYFENSLFIGDSVTYGLKIYGVHMKIDGVLIGDKIKAHAVESYGAYNATRPVSEKSTHPVYEGDQILSEDAVKLYGAKRVFICLGLNDIGYQSMDSFLKYYGELIDNISMKNAGVEIAILSTTPMTKSGEKPTLFNSKIIEYNNALIEMAASKGIAYVDIAAALRNEEGYLKDNLSSDNYCHITIPAYQLIIDYMIDHPIFTPGQRAENYDILVN